jgi:hypothetical protein
LGATAAGVGLAGAAVGCAALVLVAFGEGFAAGWSSDFFALAMGIPFAVRRRPNSTDGSASAKGGFYIQ